VISIQLPNLDTVREHILIKKTPFSNIRDTTTMESKKRRLVKLLRSYFEMVPNTLVTFPTVKSPDLALKNMATAEFIKEASSKVRCTAMDSCFIAKNQKKRKIVHTKDSFI